MLTEKEKLYLIENEAELLFNELTPEQDDFLTTEWNELSEADKELYYKVWETRPHHIEYAAKHCSPEQLTITANTLQEIRQTMIKGGANPTEFDDITAGSLMQTLNRRAEQCKF